MQKMQKLNKTLNAQENKYINNYSGNFLNLNNINKKRNINLLQRDNNFHNIIGVYIFNG